MSNAQFALRSLKKIIAVRYELDANGVQQPIPMAFATNPTAVSVSPGVTEREIEDSNCNGETVTALILKEKISPELQVTFGSVSPDVASMVFGKIWQTSTDSEIIVPFEFEATKTTIEARKTGENGSQVTGGEEGAAWYIDPLTKRTVPLGLGSDVTIGAGLQITVSQALIDAKRYVQGYVKVEGSAYEMNATELGSVGLFFIGTTNNGYAAQLSARYCQSNYQASISDGETQLTFRILPDPNAKSGYGFDFKFLGLKTAC